uniref:CW domain-containing protein n=1 Tax=Caenorhabditis japonica TaxID=281687 RepID=A0A8R1DLE2_CAEJA
MSKNIPSLLLTLSIVFLWNRQVIGGQKMIVTYGTPRLYDNTLAKNYGPWNECLEKCYENSSCVFVYLPYNSLNCFHFPFGSVMVVDKRSNEGKVAFKKTLNSTTCPLNSDPPLFGALSDTISWTTNQKVFISTMRANSSSVWLFTYTTVTCPLESQPFARGNIGVCVEIRLFDAPAKGNHTRASELCKQGNGNSLTGPASEAELEWILSTIQTTQNNVNIWLDGESLYKPNKFEMEDPTHNGVDFYGPIPDIKNLHSCLYAGMDKWSTDDYQQVFMFRATSKRCTLRCQTRSGNCAENNINYRKALQPANYLKEQKTRNSLVDYGLW